MLDKVTKAFNTIFGSKSEKDLKKLWPIVEEINSYEDTVKELTNDGLKGKTQEFRDQIEEVTGETNRKMQEIRETLEEQSEELTLGKRRELADQLDDLDEEYHNLLEDKMEELMPEAFAVLKETCRRFVGTSWKVAGNEHTWEMVPFDVQLLGAVVLHQGRIAEMKTGEGKTLAAIFPAYLNALSGHGVHIVTVNDYLAKRDAEWNEPIFNFHGLTVDCVDRYEPHSPGRSEAYKADVIYGTNNEFGFDYLRDNMVIEKDQLVQQKHHYAIIDEVDSILIDEARTPLIISGPVPKDEQSDKYEEMKPRIEALVEAQRTLVNQLVKKAEDHLEKSEDNKAGEELLRAQRGFPKNSRYRKLMQEPSIQKLVQQTENFYMQEKEKNMPIIDEQLYYSVNRKMHTIELTEKGRDFITSKDEDENFFLIPDLGDETTNIEEEIEQKSNEERRKIDENQDYSDEYKQELKDRLKEDLRKEREQKFSELHRLFAERSDRIHTVNQLLKAYTLFEREEEYIVQEGKVQIVDEHTGRVLSGRRYSDGLHQAIEAKENVQIEAATQTYATITLQNYFRMYHKLAGMTGTAATEEGEFSEIYDLDVVIVPTNEPVIRDDKEDMVFRTKREKFQAIINKIQEYHEQQQPVLVGTTSVDVSETLSRMLKRAKIPHNVLNAKQHQRESEIVANAGQKGAVTVATNMAGRGTDIKLGEGVVDRGGLAIVGSARHESRRIDLQLRGRAGRQGDPGETQFFVSLEDDLMQLFGSERVAGVMDKLNFEEGEVIQHSWITKSIERAQRKVEQNNFSIRKRQLEYDDVLNNQRSVIYDRRKHALEGDQLLNDIYEMLEELVEQIVEEHFGEGELEAIHEKMLRYLAVDVEYDREKWAEMGPDGLSDMLINEALEAYQRKEKMIAEPLFNLLKQIDLSDDGSQEKPKSVQVVFSDGSQRLRVVVDVQRALDNEGHEVARALERSAVLSIIDNKWMEHLRELDTVKEGIGLRAFGQKDPLLEYKKEAFNMFKQLLEEINQEAISIIWRAVPEVDPNEGQIQQASQRQKSKYDVNRSQAQHKEATNMGLQSGQQEQQDAAKAAGREGGSKQQPVVVEDEPGRNDYVKIQNVSTGDTKDIKWKKAKPLVDGQGWTLVQVLGEKPKES